MKYYFIECLRIEFDFGVGVVYSSTKYDTDKRNVQPNKAIQSGQIVLNFPFHTCCLIKY